MTQKPIKIVSSRNTSKLVVSFSRKNGSGVINNANHRIDVLKFHPPDLLPNHFFRFPAKNNTNKQRDRSIVFEIMTPE